MEPTIEHSSQIIVAHRCIGTSTLGMPTDHNPLDFQEADGILDDTGGTEIFWNDDIGDVSVDEEVTRLQVANSRFWDSGIGAA